MKHLVVLISGNGSNLQAIIDAAGTPALPETQVSLVVSNRTGAFGLQRAATANIPTLTMTLKAHKDAGKTREEYDADLADALLDRFRAVVGGAEKGEGDAGKVFPDLIVLAGFMHIVSASFLSRFPPGLLVNLHPALPKQFDGARAIERAWESFEKGEIRKTGVMVHRVVEEVDRGEVVVVREVEIDGAGGLAGLEAKIHAVEHELIVEGVRKALGI